MICAESIRLQQTSTRRRRQSCRPHPDRRTPRARNSQQTSTRRPRWARTIQPRQRNSPRQAIHPWRSLCRSLGSVHGRLDRITMQSHPQGHLSAPHRRRQATHGRPRRLHAQAPHHPQRHPPGTQNRGRQLDIQDSRWTRQGPRGPWTLFCWGASRQVVPRQGWREARLLWGCFLLQSQAPMAGATVAHP
jgi:hypothetical protein